MALTSTIDDLKATIGNRGGMAKANRFIVMINHPAKGGSVLSQFLPTTGTEITGVISNLAQTALGNGSVGLGAFISDPRDLSLLCESAQLPAKSITTQEYYTDMKAIKKPYAYINETVSLTFLITKDYYPYKYFQSWMDMILPNRNSVAYKAEYTTDMTIQQVDDVDVVPLHSVKLRNAYPVAISAVELSNTSESTVSRVTVEFAYDFFETESFVEGLTSGGAAGMASRLKSLFS